MSSADMETQLIERGWSVVDLPKPGAVLSVRASLVGWLREHGLPSLSDLEDYHTLVRDDARHIELLHGLAQYYWEADLGRSIAAANVELLRRLLGPDLHIQRLPYLRCVRPEKDADAAPLHRDTYYGASPYEISILIPFTDMERANAVRVISGSHLAPDSAYPYTQQVSVDVAIRSPKHQLGYPYAPRALDAALYAQTEPVPLAIGQALIFGLSLVHGGGVNGGAYTRFSTDIRACNSLAPVRFSRGVCDDYLVPLCSSPISSTARRYLTASEQTVGNR